MKLFLLSQCRAVACLPQKSCCSASSALCCWAILPQKQGDPCRMPSRSTCALLAQAVSEGTSQVSTPKSCGCCWKLGTAASSQELAWEELSQAWHSLGSWGCDSCEKSSVALRGCEGTRLATRRHLCSQAGPKQRRSAEISHLLRSPIPPTAQIFSGRLLNAADHAAQGASGHSSAEFGVQELWESAFPFFATHHKLHIQPEQSSSADGDTKAQRRKCKHSETILFC